MTIKLTVREAISAYSAIDRLPRLVDAKASHHIGVIGNKIESHVNTFERQREKLNREMAVDREEDDGKGGKRTVKKIPAEKVGEYNDRIEEMLDVAIEIARDPIKFSTAFPVAPDKLSHDERTQWEERYPRPTPSQLLPLALIIVDD